MVPLTPTHPRRRPWLAALLALGALLSSGAAQGPTDGTFYARQQTFRIPFTIDPGERRIREVQLYILDATGHWSLVSTARPGDGFFAAYTAPRDGWYAFTVRTIDQQNVAYPPTLEQAQPRLRVCVDTVKPEVSLRAVPSAEAPAAVAWEVRDDNLDAESLRLDYRPAGGADWLPLSLQKAATGMRAWDPMTNAPVEVRMQARDLAGNVGEATVTVTPGAAARPAGGGGGAGPAPSGGVRLVNQKSISITYDIKEVGKSGIAVIELWYTHNEGRTWAKYKEQADPKAPYVYTFDVPEEGLYGFTLVARNRAGGGEPSPKAGDPPQVWVEVDVTKPVVRLQGAEAGRGADLGTLTVTYSAADKNLAAQPISLSYAERPEGPWQPIASQLENTGRYVWRMPESVPYQFYVRVEAADRAGNVGSATTDRPVIVDLSQPKVQVISIGVGGNP